MELQQLIKLILKSKTVVFGTTLVFFLVGVAAAFFQPVQYEASVAVYIRHEDGKVSGQYYTYDGYYSQQAAKEYTDTVLGLLKTTDLARGAVEASNLDINPKQLLSQLKVKKVSPQVIIVSLNRPTQAEASKIVQSVVATTREKVQSLNQQYDNKFVVDSVGSSPLLLSVRPPWQVYLPVSLLLGFGFGLLLASVRAYWPR